MTSATALLALLSSCLVAFGGPEFRANSSGITGQTLGCPTVPGVTQADPSSVLTSATCDGVHVVATLEDPATISATPNAGASWRIPIRDAWGTLHDARPEDRIRLRLWTGHNGLPADVVIGAAMVTGEGAIDATTPGIGLTLQANGTSGLIMGQSLGSGVAWTNTAASSGNAMTYGAEIDIGLLTSASGQLQFELHPINALGPPVLCANCAPAAGASNGILGPWDQLVIWTGWRTGVGGTAGAVVSFSADLVVVPADRVPITARGVTADPSALPVFNNGAIPTQIVFGVVGNSHWRGAASGPVDTQFAGLAVPAGCTYRKNNEGSVTNVTVWGDREGSAPHMCEKLLSAGVTTVTFAANVGSGRSAGGILTNIGAFATDMFALGTPEAPALPDAILYVQSAGNLADQAGYDAFLVDFPAVLDQIDALFGTDMPVFVASGIAASDVDAGPFWEEVDAEKIRQCNVLGRCTYVDIFLDELDGTGHPTVGDGEGTEQISDAFMQTWGFP